ncbi:MAG: toxin-antitoxin system HicB family antitoxin [Vicinamibacterales bacterium]
MTRRGLHLRLADDEHRLVTEEAAHAGQSLNQFIATAAVGRALHARGLRGQPSPFDQSRRSRGTGDTTS